VFWLASSIAVRLLAVGWAVALVARSRDWRMGCLAGLLGIASGRQILVAWGNDFVPRETTIEAAGALIGVLTFLAVYFLDRVLTDRRDTADTLDRSEEALRDLRDQYALVAQNARDIIWSLRLDGTTDFVSPAVEQILGYTPEEQRHLPPEAVMKPHSLALAARLMRQALAGGPGEYRYEAEHIHRNGESVWCEVNAVVMRDADGTPTGLVGVTRDIRDRKEAEAHREQLQSELLHAQKMEAVGQLAGGIAHDFNNHLTVILGYADQLNDELGGHPQALRMVADVEEAAERSAALTRKLLAFSRRQVVQPRVTDPNRLIRELEPMLQRLIGANITTHFTLAPDLGRVLADPVQLEQVVVNLAVNARDAMPTGGSLSISTRNQSGSALISVADTGVGMSEETLERIFEPFFTTKPEGQGTGLGLSTVYGIARQLGGEVTCASQRGAGSTFELRLPCVEGEEDGLDATRHERVLGGDETILVVDDSSLVRRFVRNAFESRGYKVLEASDGRDALERLTQVDGVSLVVADVVMPHIGGAELARELAERPGSPRVLLMSGYTEEVAQDAGGSQGADAFLQKPFGARELLAVAREVLDRRRSDGA
jgi:two-component system cell cycle sensor histidine kinase/response regulator CckA